jgi:F0F1-type ATP synthase membrane subunit b/b'
MRKLLVAVILIVLLVAVGWLSFHYDGRQASVNFDTTEMKQDTKEALEKGERAVEQATERGREMINDVRSDNDQ